MSRGVSVSSIQVLVVRWQSPKLQIDFGHLVTMEYLIHDTRREYQKMGKVLSKTELEGLLDGDLPQADRV